MKHLVRHRVHQWDGRTVCILLIQSLKTLTSYLSALATRWRAAWAQLGSDISLSPRTLIFLYDTRRNVDGAFVIHSRTRVGGLQTRDRKEPFQEQDSQGETLHRPHRYTQSQDCSPRTLFTFFLRVREEEAFEETVKEEARPHVEFPTFENINLSEDDNATARNGDAAYPSSQTLDSLV